LREHRQQTAKIGDGICDSDYNILECGWDGGGHSMVQWWLGSAYNTKGCGGDGGDCPNPDGFPDCYADYPEKIGGGYCDWDLNNKECGRDGRDYPAVEGYPNCYVANPEMLEISIVIWDMITQKNVVGMEVIVCIKDILTVTFFGNLDGLEMESSMKFLTQLNVDGTVVIVSLENNYQRKIQVQEPFLKTLVFHLRRQFCSRG
jgi:hypothetical protein